MRKKNTEVVLLKLLIPKGNSYSPKGLQN